MSRENNTIVAPGQATSVDQSRFAHELANLLDGSMRNVSLIQSMLKDCESSVDGVAFPVDDDLVDRVGIIDDGMRQMATLLRRWMSGAHQPNQLHDEVKPLRQVVERAVKQVAATAEALRIDLVVRVEADAGRLPAGPLYPIAANGLRNSIEAIGAGRTRGLNCNRVELMASIYDGQLSLTITDNGPGLPAGLLDHEGNFMIGNTTKPTGNGLGLALCREIAISLGGRFSLRNAKPAGAVLSLNLPVSSTRASQ